MAKSETDGQEHESTLRSIIISFRAEPGVESAKQCSWSTERRPVGSLPGLALRYPWLTEPARQSLSALEWILDQYREKRPKDPTLREKFNTYRFAGYKEVIDLLIPLDDCECENGGDSGSDETSPPLVGSMTAIMDAKEARASCPI